MQAYNLLQKLCSSGKEPEYMLNILLKSQVTESCFNKQTDNYS